MEIAEIFPIPLGLSQLNRQLTEEEMNFIDSLRDVSVPNTGNVISVNKYVLDEEPLSTLKSELEHHTREYFDRVWNPVNDIDVYITTSWLTWTEQYQSHAVHNHPNSLISGTFYISAGASDTISFMNDRKKRDSLQIFERQTNQFNCITLTEFTPAGSIKLFPSSVEHTVTPKEDNHPRCCLAFNTWMKGTIGSSETSTELIL